MFENSLWVKASGGDESPSVRWQHSHLLAVSFIHLFMLTDCVSSHDEAQSGHLTSMKSALAGMYPAMSRDSTESNVGRGGSSVAVTSGYSQIHSKTWGCNTCNTTVTYSLLLWYAYLRLTCTAVLRNIRYVMSFCLDFLNYCDDMTEQCLSSTQTLWQMETWSQLGAEARSWLTNCFCPTVGTVSIRLEVHFLFLCK